MSENQNSSESRGSTLNRFETAMNRYKSRSSQGEESRPNRSASNSNSASARPVKKSGNKRSAVRPEYVFRYPCSSEFSPGYLPAGSAYERRGLVSDPSVCRYPVPLGFSVEPLSLPVYPALYTSPDNLGYSLDFSKPRKSRKKREREKPASCCRNDSLAAFETSKEIDQDYASLPPANYDARSKPTDDTETSFRRRFSDPGLAQASSDELSTDRCHGESTDSADSSDAEGRVPDVFGLVDELHDLKRSNSSLTKQLYETRSELESLKTACESWKVVASGDLRPGNLTDAICEIRDAAKMREDALLEKITYMLEENSAKCKEMRRNAEEKPDVDRFEERLQKIELRLENLLSGNSKENNRDKVERQDEEESSVRNHLVNLEKEKLQLRKELREAVEGKKKAEEDTRRLERLVGILRKKINGVSAESCIREEKPPFVVRPVASALERNPFVLANRYGFENGNFFSGSEEKKKSEGDVGESPEEHEASGSRSGEDGSSSSSISSSPTSPVQNSSLPAQVTMTGPVTDL